jgi:hypothetical protein
MGFIILLIHGLLLPFLGYIAGRDNNRRAIPVALVIMVAFSVFIYRQLCTGDAVTVRGNFGKDRTEHNYAFGMGFVIVTWMIPVFSYLFGAAARKIAGATFVYDAGVCCSTLRRKLCGWSWK